MLYQLLLYTLPICDAWPHQPGLRPRYFGGDGDAEEASAKSQRVRVVSGAARTSQVRSFFGITLAARPAPGWPELLRLENSLLCGSPHLLGAAAQRLEGGCAKPIRGQDR